MRKLPKSEKRICLSLAMAPATAKWLKQAAKSADLSASKFVEQCIADRRAKADGKACSPAEWG